MQNVNQASGIHYGVLPLKIVKQRWDELCEPLWEFDCPFCGEHLGNTFDDKCPVCKAKLNDEDFPQTDPSSFIYGEENYFIEQEMGQKVLCVLTSDYFTIADPCIGHSENAGDLTKEGKMFKAFCLGHEWFDDGAPYKVFRVKNNEEVKKDD